MSKEWKVNILYINGGPHRRGSTDIIASWVLDGCSKLGADIEEIFLSDFDIGYCVGCLACVMLGKCRVDDECQYIIDKMLKADGIIIASPVYGGLITAQLKTLFDRMTLRNIYEGLFDKQLMIGVSTSGTEPYRGVARSIPRLAGCRNFGCVGAKTVNFKGDVVSLNKDDKLCLYKRSVKLGKKMVRTIRDGKRIFDLKYEFIRLKRRKFMKKIIINNKFKSSIRVWRDRGWMN